MRKSVTFAILVAFAGYTVMSYGYVLIRGWDIPFRNWIDPLHPWIWAGTPAPIPPGQVLPHQANLAQLAAAQVNAGVTNAPQAKANATARAQGRPSPGSVQGRL